MEILKLKYFSRLQEIQHQLESLCEAKARLLLDYRGTKYYHLEDLPGELAGELDRLHTLKEHIEQTTRKKHARLKVPLVVPNIERVRLYTNDAHTRRGPFTAKEFMVEVEQRLRIHGAQLNSESVKAGLVELEALLDRYPADQYSFCFRTRSVNVRMDCYPPSSLERKRLVPGKGVCLFTGILPRIEQLPPRPSLPLQPVYLPLRIEVLDAALYNAFIYCGPKEVPHGKLSSV